ncbi:hypothetical protein NDA14_006377 [Ustilago hordei]|uniref:Uncharacterized protein n=1 Tax=Ustilago hordei TaxID=120017 RepID=I2FUP5_USTHO|nr:hypothetical protein NDA10_003152 [Ustilago hordei]KAJ1598960.1 hypothetical protein NDA14_006377 [Ustilago hordei]UTT90531.1 hypothetical protein NDA17_004470 [Ustilago hordei]CCF50638.1 uncharacterized protein UHOR_14539 [Ustilago hordei]
MSKPTKEAMQAALHIIKKSTLGSVVKVFGSVVTCNSHIQRCVNSSEVKAEDVAGSAATREVLFHRHLLQGVGFGEHMAIVFADNRGCVLVAKDPAKRLIPAWPTQL